MPEGDTIHYAANRIRPILEGVVPDVAVDWGEGEGITHVEWVFEARGPDQTFVTVAHAGFSGEGDAPIAAALDGMNGFTLVLAGAKIWLEHGIEPRFVLDRHPDMRVAEWRDR